MSKRLLFLIAFLMMGASAFAQWTNTGTFPADTVLGDGHAVAVDPDGKIWASAYGFKDSVQIEGGTWSQTRAIYVFNPDGTQTSFSPLNILEGNGIKDTLWYSTRGMKEDHEGNILYMTGWPTMYRIDYTTGALLNKVDLDVAATMTSPTAPGVDNAGNIYIEPVLPGEPVQIYDKDFNYIGNALDATTAFARTTEVSPDGLDLYLLAYTAPGIYIYHRSDEFSAFELTDSLLGFKTEAANWHPTTGRLWAGAGTAGYAEPGLFGNYQLSSHAYYEIDVATKTLTDSLFWVVEGADPAAERQRGIAFSPDGQSAYLVAFGGAGYSLIQKAVKGATDVEKLEGTPSTYELAQNYPNPFNPSTTINFSIPEAGMVSIKIYDILGKEVASLINEQKESGIYTVTFDASNLPTGTYIYKISSGNFTSSRKMLLLK